MSNSRKRKHQGDSIAYVVRIVSADKPKGGNAAAIIHIRFRYHAEIGSEHKLRVGSFPRDFKRGHINKFTVYDSTMDDVDGIELRGDAAIGREGWNIDLIKITSDEGHDIVVPIFTSIKGGSTRVFNAHHAVLPQQESKHMQEHRQKDLDKARKDYKLTTKNNTKMPLLKEVPDDEQFSFKYKIVDIGAQLGILKSYVAFRVLGHREFRDFSDIKAVFDDVGHDFFPEPDTFHRWDDDEAFGMQRLAGANCSVIELCTKIPANLGLTKEDKNKISVKIGMSLEDGIKRKKIFMVDYKILDGMTTTPGASVPAPIALFFQRADGKLVPIAIQLEQVPTPSNPVFLPADPEYTWILAKMWFNVADANYHQSIAHLGFTHLKIEGILAVTHRQIHKSHPVFKLLMPHFLYLLPINHDGLPFLLGKGQYGDKVLNAGRHGMEELIRRKNKEWRLDVDGTLPADLKRRGVDDKSLLPHYYYRSDALRVYDAICEYVTNYLQLYYPDSRTVAEDVELQAWRREIVAPYEEKGLAMLGVPGKDGKFTSLEQVCSVLINIIFACSVQHAAVNFRQYDEYAYPPSYGGCLRGAPPTSKEKLTRGDLLHYLPSRVTTFDTMVITKVLSMRAMNKLGDFEVEYITDPDALAIVKRFRHRLANITKEIKKEEKTRESMYKCLEPAQIPNSISI